ncbi:hypothetical protein ACG33_12085 [Steroidobacter denitrificans]|uniref:Divalent-cation tolerance protein CutA n=1 Tax=Steroidobacter denitrificans TaxID=465721 RepID=A0A127FBN2_STEDE|nr:divalent-cation tolerance protein CutA [Steroidobacter denitrificans]AMN47823.1 hypothetical protein ACG33_12085 [Steroidobacter denitrificans]
MTRSTPKSPIVLAWTSCPDQAGAQAIAATLVGERLAACVNRIGGVSSTYFWDGRLQEDAEVLLVMKTTAARLPDLKARLLTLHPYELPELIAVEVVGGNESYLDWVRQGVALPNEALANED